MRPHTTATVIAATVVGNQVLAAAAELGGPRTLAGIVRIAPTRNAGSVLGFAQGSPIWAALALAGVTISLALARALSARCDPTALGLLAGGAAANTFQRLSAHGVVDYVVVGSGRTGIVFNLADVALLVGAGLTMRRRGRKAAPCSRLTGA